MSSRAEKEFDEDRRIVLLVVVGIVVVSLITNIIASTADENAKREVLDVLCQRYGGSVGGAVGIESGVGEYKVVCSGEVLNEGNVSSVVSEMMNRSGAW